MDVIDIQEISWESIITYITQNDADSGAELAEFYARCLQYN
ncbi:MAG: hypothetical protein AAFV98_16800 [Chloroflexota bacterium]